MLKVESANSEQLIVANGADEHDLLQIIPS